MNIQGSASRALVVAGVCLAIGAPSASARPITDLPMHAATPARMAAAVASPDALQPQVRRLIRDDSTGVDTAVAVDRTPAPQVATGFDWVAWTIVGVGVAAVLGLIWLAASGIGRAIRPRAMHR